MKKALLAIAAVAGAGLLNTASAQLATENFNNGIPATWPMITDGANVYSSFVTNNPKLATLSGPSGKAWMAWAVGTSDSAAISTSILTTATTKADRWLITPAFTVNSVNAILAWQQTQLLSGGDDSVEIRIAPNAGTTAADFTQLALLSKVSSSGFIAKGIPLSTYNGQSIRVAFRLISTFNGVPAIDNVGTQVMTNANDLAITAVSPSASSPLAYGAVGSTVTIGGTVENKGAQPVTSFTVNYKAGSGAVVSQNVTTAVPVLGTASFSFSTAYSIAAVGSNPIKVWISNVTGDNNHANDTTNSAITGVTTMPKKRLVLEEHTSSGCGWCPRGIVFMDSMWNAHAADLSSIAVHTNLSWTDPMRVVSYDNFIAGLSLPSYDGSATGNGIPAVYVDRREVLDPSSLFDIYNDEKNYFGFADIAIATPTISGGNMSAVVTVTPAVNMSGDYRLAMVVTEDGVTGTASGYNQDNYYSYQSQDIPLSGGDKDYQALPQIIPAAQMTYNFVARGIFPSNTGAAGSLPATMTAGQSYSYTITAPLTSTWNANNLSATILLLDNANGQVLNSNNTRTLAPVKVSNVLAGVNEMVLYPNPTDNVSTLKFSLNKASHVTIQVVDMVGHVVSTIADKNLTNGQQSFTINTANMAAGIYNVRINTENGVATERLSVIK